MRTFRLYPEEQHWWSYNDYNAVLDVMERLHPKTVLEFGPGSSTLALVEGGAESIDTCEDNPDWAEVYEDRLQTRFQGIVHVHRYTWSDPIHIPAVDGKTYDLALIDGPLGTDSRSPVVRYAMQRCRDVLVPTEDANRTFRQTLIRIAAELGWSIGITETGPLSGGFALLSRVEVQPWRHEVAPVLSPGDPVTETVEALTTRRKKNRGRRPTGTPEGSAT